MHAADHHTTSTGEKKTSRKLDRRFLLKSMGVGAVTIAMPRILFGADEEKGGASLVERLGYPKDARVLITAADEFGQCQLKILELEAEPGTLFDFGDRAQVEFVLNRDICDYDSIEGEFSDIDLVIHLAGVVSFSLRDKELLEHVLGEMGLNLSVEYSLNCWGGLIAKSSDSRVVIINTLEARFNRALPFLRRHLAASFENQQTAVSYQLAADG